MNRLTKQPPLSPPTRAPGVQAAGAVLSQRELEVLRWLVAGASNREIGRRLYITESTVKRHVYNIFGKLSVRNRTQAAIKATQLGNLPAYQL
jgi:DNA-binding NarL/FixJ family response regulator